MSLIRTVLEGMIWSPEQGARSGGAVLERIGRIHVDAFIAPVAHGHGAGVYSAPMMIERNWGRIIWVSSQSGLIGIPGQPVYCSTKGAVIQLVRTLGGEWAKHGIAAGAVITNDVPPRTFAEGVPARHQPLPAHLDRPANRKLTRQPVDLWHPLTEDLSAADWPEDWPEGNLQ